MHPLSRAALLAGLCALPAAAGNVPIASLPMGRCVGNAAPEAAPSGGPVFEYASDPNAAKQLPYWNLIGYTQDDSGHLVGPDGRPVGAELMAWMSEAEDFSRVRVPETMWGALVGGGYRLDEQGCTMKGPQGPLSRFAFRVYREDLRLGYEKAALEHLKAGLAGLDAGAPVPAAIEEEAKALAQAGVRLPPGVAKILADGGRVGALAASVDSAYASATRYFDGKLEWGALAKGALPPVPGVTAARPKPAVMGPEEERLGRLFAAELERKFSLTPEGRELLDAFRGKDGKVRFPPILFLKQTQRPDDRSMPGAVFDFVNGAMVLNHWQAMAIVVGSLPPAERDRRAREFTDPTNLRRYLEAHAEAREALIDEFDSGFYHEFVHAWQSRRSSYDIEMVRGNAPGNNPLVKEHEAYREQCRYEFSLVFRDPPVIEKRAYMSFCLPMLKDYDGFRDMISRSYLSTFAGTSELSDVVKIQKERESMARRLMGEGLYQRALQTFKLAGMFQGDEALRDLQLDSAQRERKFLRERLPPLRARALSELPPAYGRLERPDLGLMILNNLPPDQPGLPESRRAWVHESESAVIRPNPRLTTVARAVVVQATIVELQAQKAPVSEALAAAYSRDVRAYVRALTDQGNAATDPKVRDALMKAAADWSALLPKGDARRRLLAPREGKQ